MFLSLSLSVSVSLSLFQPLIQPRALARPLLHLLTLRAVAVSTTHHTTRFQAPPLQLSTSEATARALKQIAQIAAEQRQQVSEVVREANATAAASADAAEAAAVRLLAAQQAPLLADTVAVVENAIRSALHDKQFGRIDRSKVGMRVCRSCLLARRRRRRRCCMTGACSYCQEPSCSCSSVCAQKLTSCPCHAQAHTHTCTHIHVTTLFSCVVGLRNMFCSCPFLCGASRGLEHEQRLRPMTPTTTVTAAYWT